MAAVAPGIARVGPRVPPLLEEVERGTSVSLREEVGVDVASPRALP